MVVAGLSEVLQHWWMHLMDQKEFLKKLQAVAAKENRGAVKLSSREKRAERREFRFKQARLREKNERRNHIVREMIEDRRIHKLAAVSEGDETSS
jgi:hypothetical protein